MKKQLNIDYEEFNSYSKLDDRDRELVGKAEDILSKAYAPYSNFKVGAALRLSNGEIICGTNQENLAFPSGLCAERVALNYAKSEFPEEKVVSLAIVAENSSGERNSITPCGACRQVMLEVEGRDGMDIELIMPSNKGQYLKFQGVKRLLPFAFITKIL